MAMTTNPEQQFLNDVKLAFIAGNLLRLKVSKPVHRAAELLDIVFRPVELQGELKLSAVYHYQTKDVTKNFLLADALTVLTGQLGQNFKNAVLFTPTQDVRLSYNKKMEPAVIVSKASVVTPANLQHDQAKQHLIKLTDNAYLRELGVLTESGQIAQNMSAKYKQINKFIEILAGLIKNSPLAEAKDISAVDMGSGKGYLTFAVYDYLVNTLQRSPTVTGVEVRQNLVELCNEIADNVQFTGLHFSQGTIQGYPAKPTDIVMALHACDTATDDAIYQGIMAQAAIIIVSPCCHKQIRSELHVTDALSDITQYGILKERLAEMVTDTLRSLVLEAHGYKTQIIEFISDEHTHKNLMITGVKTQAVSDKDKILEKIAKLKTLFGIKNFYLDSLFNNIN